ncbi:MAG: PLD nuclease N-terminal domain-containing protein [Candidatus Nanopelagicales bacterium]
MLRVAGVLLGLAMYIWFVIDVIRTPSSSMRTLPKFVWLLIVVLIPLIGGILWYLGGRPRRERRGKRRGPTAPDDDPTFLRHIGDNAWSQKMKRRRDETDGSAPA